MHWAGPCGRVWKTKSKCSTKDWTNDDWTNDDWKKDDLQHIALDQHHGFQTATDDVVKL